MTREGLQTRCNKEGLDIKILSVEKTEYENFASTKVMLVFIMILIDCLIRLFDYLFSIQYLRRCTIVFADV